MFVFSKPSEKSTIVHPSNTCEKHARRVKAVITSNRSCRAVGSLEVRASDSRPEGLGLILDTSEYTMRNFAEPIRTVTCMVFKAKAIDRHTSSPLPETL
ncbi:hypothetical protein TNCV_2229191 [Trichonephila clavipes]|nr:hypothetical protein TNCV_2229191 [Trichonephila clavipes]